MIRAGALAGAVMLALSTPALAQLQLGPPPGNAPPSAAPPAAAPAPAAPKPAARAPAQRPGNVRQVKPVEPTEPPTPDVPGETPAPGTAAPAPGGKARPGDQVAPGAPDETVIAPPKQKIANSTAVFSGLDKITGRIIVFDVAIDETVQFGALQVTPRVCYTRPPTETPQTDAFVEVNEVTLAGEVKKLFTGWMFAASPGLSGVEHAVYDVWLADCKQGKPTIAGGDKPKP